MSCSDLNMSCEQFVQFIIDYLEESLDPKQRGIFERHICACKECDTFLESYRNSIDVVRLITDEDTPPPPEGLVKAVLSAIRDDSSFE